MNQLTLDDAERQWHIARLTRSLERWQAQELDRILPEQYAHYRATLAHLEAGGAYQVTRFDPDQTLRAGGSKTLDGPMGEMVRDIGRGLAGISRSTAGTRPYWKKTEAPAP
jgi:hypothetical protein